MRVAGIAREVASLPTAVADGLHRMALHYPVTDVDGVNILLHNNVARQHAILYPVPQARDRLRRVRIVKIDAGTIVISGPRSDLTQRTSVDALHQLHIRRRHADLETHIQA